MPAQSHITLPPISIPRRRVWCLSHKGHHGWRPLNLVGAKDAIVEYLLREFRGADTTKQQSNANGWLGIVYLMGDSSFSPPMELHWPGNRYYVELRGLILVNPATSYVWTRSAHCQYSMGWQVSIWIFIGDQIEDCQRRIAIPNERNECMGRVAFDLPNRLTFMPNDT